jgi:hypothetical protein
MRQLAWTAALFVAATGCAHGASDASAGGELEAGVADDGSLVTQSVDAAAGGVDAGGSNDASIDDASRADGASGDAANAVDSGLSPLLDPPDPSGTPCTNLGTGNDCASGEICRISSTTGGRCEGCSGACGNPGDPCAQSKDCNTLYQCYAGHCRGLCPLGMPGGVCAVGATCIDVGNATTGVCSK